MHGLIATWSTARSAWEKPPTPEPPGALFELPTSCEHSELYSGIWPTSGSMRNGSCYQRPQSAPRTGASASSSSPGPLLLTPTSQLAINGGSQPPEKRQAGGHGPTLADQVEHMKRLLPTPRAKDGNGGVFPLERPESMDNLETRITRMLPESGALLPTPRATDGTKGGPNQRGSSGDLMLPSAVAQLLPTPMAADGGPRGSTSGWGLRNEVKKLLPTPTATPYGSNQSPTSGAQVRPSLETLAGELLPTPTASFPGSTANFRPDGTPYGEGYGMTLLDAVRLLPTPRARDSKGCDPNPRGGDLNNAVSLLPTPMAADGDRTSTEMPRGNPTLLGALAPSTGPARRTPPRSTAGKRSSDAKLPGQLTIEDA